MHDTVSTPDNICTADFALERNCIALEEQASIMRGNVEQCYNPKMLLSALVTLDAVTEQVERLKSLAESRVHACSFAAELFVA